MYRIQKENQIQISCSNSVEVQNVRFFGGLYRQEGTPFKIAYRTRNEFLLYVVNNLPYNKDKDGNDLPQGYVIARALDEITSMKILSRIEGDDTKVKDSLLNALSQTITDGLNTLTDEDHIVKSVSVAKLEEMKNRLQFGYTSFWS